MSKTKLVYHCSTCGAQTSKWSGQCGSCDAWNTIVEEPSIVVSKSSRHPRFAGYAAPVHNQITLLSEVEHEQQPRLSTGIKEFDHVLGEGLVPGSVILIGGDPGIGKSTLLLQVLATLSLQQKVLYVTGEESLHQVAMRSHRLGLSADNIHLLPETQIEKILTLAQQEKPHVIVVDSIQTMYTDLLQSAPGSVGQVRESAAQLVQYAKQTGTALFLVGHVTKEGTLAGPRVLEHMVDTVLYFEGQSDHRYRMIRAVKNRFGAVNELGVFAMTEKGLREVTNPSAIFLSGYASAVPGNIVMVTREGTRPLLVELQALVDKSYLANPRRVTVGLEQNRLSMLLAVLHRHGNIATYDQDVFVNVVGGVRVTETAADLALLLSVFSSLRNKSLPQDLIAFGEVGLAGEIRPVQSGQERLKEAAKHGFKRALISSLNAPKNAIPKMEIISVNHINQALSAVL